MADFENINFTDNILNKFQSYTYHLTLTMVNPLNIDLYMDDAGAIKAEEQIVIAQTGSTTLLNIDGLDVQTHMSFGAGARDALGARGQFVIYEPVTFNFYKFLSLSCQDLGIAAITLAQYILTVRFMTDPSGQGGTHPEPDVQSAGTYSWPIKITSVDSSYGSAGEGSQHICNFIEVGFADLQDDLRLKKGITIENSETFGDAIKTLQTKLYEQEYDDVQSEAPTRGVTDVYKITVNYPSLSESKWIAEKYSKYTSKPPTLNEVVLQPSFSFKAGVSISNIIKTLWQATQLNKTIVDGIEASKKADSKAKKADPGAAARGGGPTAAKSGKKEKVSYRLKYYTLNTNVKSTMFDDTRDDYALFWDIQLDPYTVIDHRNAISAEKESESVKNLEEKSASGHFQKFYRYQFTGLNTDVLNFDMKFNVLYYIANAPYAGELSTSGGTTQAKATLSQEKKDKVGVGPDGTVNVVVRNPPSTGGNLGMGSLQPTNPTFQVVTIEPTARKYKSIQTDLPQKFAEEFTSDISRAQPLKRRRGTFITSRGSDEDNKTSMTQKSNYQLMNLENVTDLVNVELEIRGDPYWFGRPRKVSNAKQKNIKQDFPDQYQGSCHFLLDTRFGEEYSLDDGLIHTDQLDIFAGMYQVIVVTSNFQQGVFKQYLKAIRMMNYKNTIISKLMLAAKNAQKEQPTEEASDGGGIGTPL